MGMMWSLTITTLVIVELSFPAIASNLHSKPQGDLGVESLEAVHQTAGRYDFGAHHESKRLACSASTEYCN